MPFSTLWVPLHFGTQFLIYFETFSYKTWKMRCTRKKPLADVVGNSGESQLVSYLEKRMYQRKQGWSHVCLPFHFKSNGCVESLIFMEISSWISHSGISLVGNCWVNVPVICFVLLIGCTFYTLLFQQLALCATKSSTAYPKRTSLVRNCIKWEQRTTGTCGWNGREDWELILLCLSPNICSLSLKHDL